VLLCVLCESDNDGVSSTSTKNANCSPRWIVYPNSHTDGDRLSRPVTTVLECLGACVSDINCTTVEWVRSERKCWLHYMRPSTRVHRANVTQFDIVRRCNNTSGTWAHLYILCCKFYKWFLLHARYYAMAQCPCVRPFVCLSHTRVISSQLNVYIGWQWQNFFISYLCHLFFRHFVGASSAKCLLSWHHFLSKIMIIRTFS